MNSLCTSVGKFKALSKVKSDTDLKWPVWEKMHKCVKPKPPMAEKELKQLKKIYVHPFFFQKQQQ